MHKIEKEDIYKVNKALEIIKDVNKKISEFDVAKYTEVDIIKFIDLITNQYFDSHGANIKINTEGIKKNTLILLDRDKIDTIVNNLIINAIEYMKHNNIELIINVSIIFKKSYFLFIKKESICFIVGNEGIIITSIGKKIFENGFSTKQTQTSNYNSGIGLYHSKKLAKKMKGTLTHISINNQVTFYLNVPLMKK